MKSRRTLTISRQNPGKVARLPSKYSALTQVRGMGIGLTACKRIIEAHQGRIWLESEEGVGSVFAFALPLNLQDEQ